MIDREQIFYEKLKSDLRQAVRFYLHRTEQPYPVYFIFNMPGIEPAIE